MYPLPVLCSFRVLVVVHLEGCGLLRACKEKGGCGLLRACEEKGGCGCSLFAT